ncbi:MAG: DUF2972 domain-containing protein [Helicobacter bilis]|uniref:DUF2972 domain-containing protein n=1 Tax=Helicobacter bilis TaxID=37372 RepID=UPI0026F33BB8|nr:DUF2972 domain-containing protein [Helicobacter bilis]MCI7411179.1 DUF2972 domain-containing protein [Helicobacter bilis]
MIIANPIFFAKNLKKHIEWLESDTFKKEYIDTITQKYNIKFDSMHDFINLTPPPPTNSQTTQNNQSLINSIQYPPLINPRHINYDTTYSGLAWALNLPLPNNYKFVRVASHGVGVNSTTRMFEALGVVEILTEDFHQKLGVESYKIYFEELQYNKYDYNFLTIIEYDINRCVDPDGYHKFLHLIQANVPVLCQMRDPIGLIRHMLNRNFVFKQHEKINLTSDYHEITKYLNRDDFTTNDISNRFLFGYGRIFPQNALVSLIKHSYVRYIDMKEISTDTAFETFKKLSKEFGFKKPTKECKKPFTTNVFTGNLLMILPIYLYVDAEDIDNIYSKHNETNNGNATINENAYLITIDFPKNTDEIDISPQVCSGINHTFSIYIKKDKYESLCADKKLHEAVFAYLTELISEIDFEVKRADKNLVREKDILEYLRHNKEERQKLKAILDPNLTHIKKHRPDIVNNWEYYMEFEEMCKQDNVVTK